MRGKGEHLAACVGRQGITPAHAGKRALHPSSRSRRRDHPRACGEKSGLLLRAAQKGGSPPRMRGKDRVVNRASVRLGITPAHAGKSTRKPARPRFPGDHPRACGEKVPLDGVTVTGKGSPPRMRGKVLREVKMVSQYGITPAHAGKSPCAIPGSGRPRDHPRACGEKNRKLRKRRKNTGSPPRMRGKGHAGESVEHRGGITPAHAGKRLKDP